jgi:AraC family transcriptional regulator
MPSLHGSTRPLDGLERIDHLDPMPENLLSFSSSRRNWNGVVLDVTEFHCAGRVVHQLSNDMHARLSVVVEEIGDPCEPRLRPDTPCPIGYMPRHMLYAPPGMEVWGYSANTRYVKDATLSFELATLSERLGTRFHSSVVHAPRMRFVDEHIWPLVRRLADAVNDPDPSMQLYGDGLTTAIAARLLTRSHDAPRPRDARLLAHPLAPWQLRRVLDYLDASLPDHIALAELAALSGLSQWHFSRAFKASTGLAPYRWQLEARIRRAQALLVDTRASLEQIAEATGFADAVHFGKTFRKIVGATPATWRKAKKT